MDSRDKKATQMQSARSENKAAMEVKGVVEAPPVTKRGGKENMEERKAKPEEPKGLPHQQVPQPGDFSSEALEHI
ncbi:hypothetical protein TorRG33x02_200180 [Trema orientale]|uniref:Uncharacterized protein n=1 Tax=Trema orientale TaxID=63057 RepID=A0A2P5EFG4_TREOI|nr:hypothetical protein TorRG33x02_200180 [Trema orientale]